MARPGRALLRRGGLGPRERHHGRRRRGRRRGGDGARPARAGCRRSSASVRARPAARGALAAAAPRWLRGVTLRALADFRLGHEGKPSSRAVCAPASVPGPLTGRGSNRAPSRSIHCCVRQARRAPRGCRGPRPGRRGGRHADAWPVPPGDDHRGWSRTVPGWPGGCRRRLTTLPLPPDGELGAASTCSTRSCSSSSRTPSTSSSQSHDATSCWSEPPASPIRAAA